MGKCQKTQHRVRRHRSLTRSLCATSLQLWEKGKATWMKAKVIHNACELSPEPGVGLSDAGFPAMEASSLDTVLTSDTAKRKATFAQEARDVADGLC